MRVLVFSTIALTLCGCAGVLIGGGAPAGSPAERDRPSATMQASDAEVSRQIESRLSRNPATSGYVIEVRVSGGIARLSGIVAEYASRETAEKIALATDGVRAVDNQIEVVYTN